MFRMGLPVVLLAAVLTAGPLRAEVGVTFASGEKFHAWCTGQSKALQNFCMTYVAGVADVLAFSPVGTIRACLPKGEATIGQAVRKVKDWMEANPDEMRFSAVSIVARALADAYPCPASGGETEATAPAETPGEAPAAAPAEAPKDDPFALPAE